MAGYTSRIRALESKVGDVSLRLQTLEADLALHQKRLDVLNRLFKLQSERFAFLEGQYAQSMETLRRRLVDIYESDQASTLDVFLGAANVQEALDQVAYLTDIGIQDRHIANEVAYAKAQVKAAREKTKAIRTTVHGETQVISARTAQTRDVRDELVGARNDLASTRQQKVTDRRSCRRRRARRPTRSTRSRRRAPRSRSGSARRRRARRDTPRPRRRRPRPASSGR